MNAIKAKNAVLFIRGWNKRQVIQRAKRTLQEGIASVCVCERESGGEGEREEATHHNHYDRKNTRVSGIFVVAFTFFSVDGAIIVCRLHKSAVIGRKNACSFKRSTQKNTIVKAFIGKSRHFSG